MMKSQMIIATILLNSLILVPLDAQKNEVNMQTNVPMVKVIQDAVKVAETNKNWGVMLGDGESMVPHFGRGSVVLYDRAPYSKLQPGMVVIFRDSDGDLVGHWLVKQESTGWVTQGVNNSNYDPELMSEADYQGVVFGVLNSSGADSSGLAYAQQLGLQHVIGKSR